MPTEIAAAFPDPWIRLYAPEGQRPAGAHRGPAGARLRGQRGLRWRGRAGAAGRLPVRVHRPRGHRQDAGRPAPGRPPRGRRHAAPLGDGRVGRRGGRAGAESSLIGRRTSADRRTCDSTRSSASTRPSARRPSAAWRSVPPSRSSGSRTMSWPRSSKPVAVRTARCAGAGCTCMSAHSSARSMPGGAAFRIGLATLRLHRARLDRVRHARHRLRLPRPRRERPDAGPLRHGRDRGACRSLVATTRSVWPSSLGVPSWPGPAGCWPGSSTAETGNERSWSSTPA